GPGFIVDQRRLLTGIELTLMCNPTGVNRVRQYSVEVSAREGCATALGAIRRGAALLRNPSRSAASLTRRTQPCSRYSAKMRRTVAASAGSMASVRSLARYPSGGLPPLHKPLFFYAAVLSRVPSPVASPSNCAKGNHTLKGRSPHTTL